MYVNQFPLIYLYFGNIYYYYYYSGTILKRYLKFRNVKNIIMNIKNNGGSGANSIGSMARGIGFSNSGGSGTGGAGDSLTGLSPQEVRTPARVSVYVRFPILVISWFKMILFYYFYSPLCQ